MRLCQLRSSERAGIASLPAHLDVAVRETVVVHEGESVQQLRRERRQHWRREVLLALAVRLQVAVKGEERVAQQLGDDDQVLLEVEVVEKAQELLLAVWVLARNEREHAHLAETRVEAVLVVAQHLDAHHALAMQVVALPHAARHTGVFG